MAQSHRASHSKAEAGVRILNFRVGEENSQELAFHPSPPCPALTPEITRKELFCHLLDPSDKAVSPTLSGLPQGRSSILSFWKAVTLGLRESGARLKSHKAEQAAGSSGTVPSLLSCLSPLDYLCSPEENIYKIDFVRFKIRDMDSGTVLFEIKKPPASGEQAGWASDRGRWAAQELLRP